MHQPLEEIKGCITLGNQNLKGKTHLTAPAGIAETGENISM